MNKHAFKSEFICMYVLCSLNLTQFHFILMLQSNLKCVYCVKIGTATKFIHFCYFITFKPYHSNYAARSKESLNTVFPFARNKIITRVLMYNKKAFFTGNTKFGLKNYNDK